MPDARCGETPHQHLDQERELMDSCQPDRDEGAGQDKPRALADFILKAAVATGKRGALQKAQHSLPACML